MQNILLCIGFLFIFLLISKLIFAPQIKELQEEFESNIDKEPSDKEINLPNEYNSDLVKQYISQTALNMIQRIKPTQQGPPGPSGPRGVEGPAGAEARVLYPIRSISNPSLVMERLYGQCPDGKVILNDQTWEPEQSWVFTKEGQIKNNAGLSKDCITVNSQGNICLTTCAPTGRTPPPLEQRWSYDGSNRFISKKLNAGKQQCLSIKKGSIQANPTYQDKRAGNKTSATKLNNMSYLVLEECTSNQSIPPEHRWALY